MADMRDIYGNITYRMSAMKSVKISLIRENPC